MFTGLIQTLGTITQISAYKFAINYTTEGAEIIHKDLEIGDSVAVDGVCLTVEEILPLGFIASASPETLKRTTLGLNYTTGNHVNLETSLRVGSKLGGHFVTGHIDGVGCLQSVMETATSWEMIFTYPAEMFSQWRENMAKYIIAKGSVAVNGISLTIADSDRGGNWFKVAVIPHTYAETNLRYLQSGSLVNLEADILGKYVEKLLNYHQSSGDNREITSDFLTENGYL